MKESPSNNWPTKWNNFDMQDTKTWPSEESKYYLVWVDRQYGDGDKIYIAKLHHLPGTGVVQWSPCEGGGGNFSDFVTHWCESPPAP